jgi:hypothetical protein
MGKQRISLRVEYGRIYLTVNFLVIQIRIVNVRLWIWYAYESTITLNCDETTIF